MSRTSLAETAYRELIRMILEGQLKPGDTLQEVKLCEVLGMSRTPVREAIGRIDSDGLAEQKGRFFRVRRITAEEIDEIFFLRLALEPACARNAAGRMDVARLHALEVAVRALLESGPGQDDLQWHVDQDLHLAFAGASGNAPMVRVIAELHRRTCIYDHRVVPERFAEGCAEHLALIEAVRSGDGAGAEALMTAHLTQARDAIVTHLAGADSAATDITERTAGT
ncbi:GntR family transcriptional regulator [Salipiger pallidus]|uniref:GntR family transcriptional regulator n=1 Tax=Salipiger pallidus TaxID=1775170 RepID=A0A8J3EHT6_9RHOB|nr:GntR family transcriptional regulator [Salipiger pallidus]GGG82590.1 GntR family transcriptional regulator [Salipiger pallidus]